MSENNFENDDIQNSNIKSIDIVEEMNASFIDYAMSVIVSRALPDARDGLKPIHRRIMYALHTLEMFHNKPYKKSARVVGEVLAKYHPHGDSAAYEAMVRMAQDFSLRYPLVDGQGNFGSIDGDSAAAMRYTEVRMSKISSQLLQFIDKETVSFIPNYDGSEKEPTVLPSLFPNLLVNGSTGIAVGMATSIPPHNLNEVIDGVIAYAKNHDISINDLIGYVKGPDFPTSGIIQGDIGIRKAYETGSGSAVINSKVDIEKDKNDNERLIVSEIPYMINKSRLIEKIANLVRSKSIEGISDIRDESNKGGVRIVIEIKKSAIANVILNKLFKSTPLRSSFSMNLIALVKGVPEHLNLKQMISTYWNHQREILLRKSRFELHKLENRLHIVEGLVIALNKVDEVIKLIRANKTPADAQRALEEKYNFSEKQSKSIVDMRLARLTSLETNKLEEEMKNIKSEIEELKAIISDNNKSRDIIINQLEEIKKQYGDERKTEIISGNVIAIDDEDLIPNKDIVVYLSKNGYIKRTPLEEYRQQKRGGKGARTATTHEDDQAQVLIITNTHTDLLLFSDLGKVYRIRSHQVPEYSKTAKGIPVINLIKSMEKTERIKSLLTVIKYDDESTLFFTTEKGIVKRTDISEFARINKNGKIAITLKPGDNLFKVKKARDEDEILLGSISGKVARFKASDVRAMGRTAAGVIGMNIDEESKIIGLAISSEGGKVLSLSEKGFGKLSNISEYRITKRGAKGVNALDVKKAGRLIAMRVVSHIEELIVMTEKGIVIRTPIEDIKVSSRNTKGVKIINIHDDDQVTSVDVVRVLDQEEIEKTLEMSKAELLEEFGATQSQYTREITPEEIEEEIPNYTAVTDEDEM